MLHVILYLWALWQAIQVLWMGSTMWVAFGLWRDERLYMSRRKYFSYVLYVWSVRI